MKLETYKIGERNICLKGIGKMLQSGLNKIKKQMKKENKKPKTWAEMSTLGKSMAELYQFVEEGLNKFYPVEPKNQADKNSSKSGTQKQ